MGHRHASTPPAKTWTLIGCHSKPYQSAKPGVLDGHRRSKIYGRLDPGAALQAIACSGYVNIVYFFKTRTPRRPPVTGRAPFAYQSNTRGGKSGQHKA